MVRNLKPALGWEVSSYWTANFMEHKLRILAIIVLILTLLTLAACSGIIETPAVSSSGEGLLLPMLTATIDPCAACAQATLIVAMTQDKNNADLQAAATAAILLANAQATLNSVNATVGAAQTQEKNNANIIAAQIAATAAIVRANAQATLNSAAATQSAALTQDAIQQTQIAGQATTGAQAILDQEYKDSVAAGTQTAVANQIATQTQVAVATSQWYVDQARQRDEQRQGPITFLWMICLPAFAVLLVGLFLWGAWRWLRIQQANQRILENPVDRLQPPEAEVIDHQQNDPSPYLETRVVNSRYQLTKPEDQASQWVDEVKRKLLSSDKKDEDDNSDV